jgi:hypothetical protein
MNMAFPKQLFGPKIDYPDEVHDEVEECFIILKGKCSCYIEGETIESRCRWLFGNTYVQTSRRKSA